MLDIADARPEASLKEKLKNFGEVKVELFRCKAVGVSTVSRKSNSFVPVVQSGIPEKALKGRAISNYAT